MNKKKINKIIDDEQAMQQILSEAMRSVGSERDRNLINQMSAMSQDEFRSLLAKPDVKTPKVSAFARFVKSTYFRAAAACLVCVLLIWGVSFIQFPDSTSGYASMFNKYYTEYTATPFDACDDMLNAKGGKSTAKLIEEASELLSQKSRRNTSRAIDILESLLDNNWRKTSLDPEIHWYLGLAYIKDGQRDKAIQQLQIVSETGKAHNNEAAKLLKELKNKI